MKKCLSMFLTMLILSGCVEKEILDDVNLITSIGFDLIDKESIRGSAVINTYIKDQPVNDYVITDESKLSRDILDNMQKQSPDQLVLGKIEIVLFGEDLAKKDISDLVDTLQRDASIGERLQLAVARGESKTVLDSKFENQGASNFISNIIQHNKLNRDLPRSNLHLFLYQFYSKGQDPYLPFIKKNEQTGGVEIDGLALFDDKKVVGSIPNDQLLFFKTLADQYTKGSYTLELAKENHSAGIKSIASSRELKVKSLEPLKVEVKVKVEGYIHEYTGKRITPEVIKDVERVFEEKMKNEINSLFTYFKELKIDPVGIGDQIRSQSREFNIENWRDRIPELTVDVIPEVIISESGVIE
ncbi:spore germination protein [Metabacillus crassostreae]|uniref:Ger(x)C family spore germination protein n=1 Tax=Metabacillus crassostreae TaxID=929098 RepID=UPI00195B63F3|nr:Ger(x)C family spore germination protein [Metabacillus crassostreae]MBM7603633.1 spore germination protein [Metabacillus crassostreae]